MFETTVGTRKLDRDDVELTQQFTPIFQALLSGALGGGAEPPVEDDFRRDPLAAPLPTQLSTSPAETVPPSTRPAETAPAETALTEAASAEAALTEAALTEAALTEAALTEAALTEAALTETALTETASAEAALTEAALTETALTDAERTRLHAIPVATGGAHRAEPHARGRAGRLAARSGAHRAPETEPQQPDADRPATSRGGRHRTLRAVVH